MAASQQGRGLQREFYRNGADYRHGDDATFADVQRRYDFYSVKIGRWVTKDEQQRAANLFYDALRDLEVMLQVPPQVISLNGSLGLNFAIGGQRHSCAHYEPQARVLALAKNAGGGSLAHEWFHAFDHYICPRMYANLPQVPSLAFASKMWLVQREHHQHALNRLLSDAFKTLFLNADGSAPSDFMTHCLAVDRSSSQAYFALPEEISARAFEHMLQSLHQKNHFLVAGTQQSETARAGLYPPADISYRVGELWLTYFKHLGVGLTRDTLTSR